MQTILVVGPCTDLPATLRRKGYHVLCALKGEEAFRLLKQFVISRIVCNLRLADMSAVDFRRRLLASPEWSSIPVVGLSQEPESEQERSMYSSILRTPIDLGALLKAISPASPS